MAPYDPSKWDVLGERYAFFRNVEYDPRNYQDMFERVPRPCHVAVDVGCGGGLLAGELAPLCDTVLAYDISWGMILEARDHLRRHGATNVRLALAEADRPPLADAGTDLVFSVNVLHHTDLNASLPALARVVRPGGRLLARVITTRNSGLAGSWPLRILRSLAAAPGYFRKHGTAAGLKISALLFHPRWLHDSDRPHPTRAGFAAAAARLLPGSTVVPAWRGGATVYWERPAEDRVPLGTPSDA